MENQAYRLVYQLNQLSETHASCLPCLLIHLDLCVSMHTLCRSLFSKPGWKWAPYLLHCPLNDAVPQWDKDASQDGNHRPKHSSDYQRTPSVTAAHGGVRFTPYDRLSAWQLLLLLSLCWCVLVCAACLCLCPSRGGSSTGRLYHQKELTEQQRPDKGTDTSGRHPGTSYKWSYIMSR